MNPSIHDSIMAEKISLFSSRKIPRGVQGSLLLLLLSRWESESDGEDEDDDDEHRQSKIRVYPSHQHGQCLAHLRPLSVTPPGCKHAPGSVHASACFSCSMPVASSGFVAVKQTLYEMKSISWRASHPKHLFVQLSQISYQLFWCWMYNFVLVSREKSFPPKRKWIQKHLQCWNPSLSELNNWRGGWNRPRCWSLFMALRLWPGSEWLY